MSGLWWLQDGWGAARCACGVNIQQSGGDPDWGECYECKVKNSSSQASNNIGPTEDDYCEMGGHPIQGNGSCYCGKFIQKFTTVEAQ